MRDVVPHALDGLRALLPAHPALAALAPPLLLAQHARLARARVHARADPPPPAQEALPEHDREHQAGEPVMLVLRRDVHERERRAEQREHACARAERGGAPVGPPGAPPVDEQAPEEERGGEEEGERRVADVGDDVGERDDVRVGVDGQELHDGGQEGEWAE